MSHPVELLLIVFAGIANASFIIPRKLIKSISNEKVWVLHSILGLICLPWIFMFFLFPFSLNLYFSLSIKSFLILIFGGIIFGLGQICFAYAMDAIGIALSFAINLGVGVTVGSLLIVLGKGLFFTKHGALVSLSVLMIIFALMLNYLSSYRHKKIILQKNDELTNRNKNSQKLGWLLASLAGLASGFQNVVFVYLLSTSVQFHEINSFWVWPPFLFFAAVPMIIGFSLKKKLTKNHGIQWTHFSLVLGMGFLFTGSLALYSEGMTLIGPQLQILGWPTLMVSIVLFSQLWGWIFRESFPTNKKEIAYQFFSLFFMILSFFLINKA